MSPATTACLYRVVQAHKSQADWTPDKVPALWTPVRKVAGAAPDEWVQPAGARRTPSKGDRVLFQGATYESVIDANVWSPTAYPAGWKKCEPVTIGATELLEPAPNTPSFMAGYGSKVIAVGRNMVPSGGHSLIALNGTYRL